MNEIDVYIQQFPIEVQERLNIIRKVIQNAAPEAKEKISWQMPTYYYNGNVVHFAAQKKHIGFYPGDTGVSQFEDKLAEYKHTKGAIQFPFTKPLPLELIGEITRFRMEEQKNK